MAELRHFIDPGELSRQIIVQTASADTVNDFGESTSSWYNLHTLYAKAEWKSGEEKVDAEQVTSYERVDFTIRYKGDITAKMRVSFDGDYYDIEGVSQVGGRKRFELLRTRKYDSNQ